jgi:hypothetical protein
MIVGVSSFSLTGNLLKTTILKPGSPIGDHSKLSRWDVIIRPGTGRMTNKGKVILNR